MRLTLCLLTRNERECLEIIYPRIPAPSLAAGFDEIVAIDGGSTDGTLEFYRDNGIPILGQSRRGRGEAFQLAFREIHSDGYIFFSPDGNEDPADLPKFRPLLAAGADLVIASRMMPGAVNEEDGQFLRFRKWANNGFNLMANVGFRRTGRYITDSINGYRALTARAARLLNLDAPDYTIEYQMTMRALKQRLQIVEFPTCEGQRVAGGTGAPSLSTGMRFIGRFYSELKLR